MQTATLVGLLAPRLRFRPRLEGVARGGAQQRAASLRLSYTEKGVTEGAPG